MNKLLLATLLLAWACHAEVQSTQSPNEPTNGLDWTEHAVIYEVNLRHYSPEGNIAEFRKHLPRLKDLGVDVLWFMPIQPIGMKRRKAEGNTYVEDLPEAQQARYLGSPYSIRDYTDVNPDYGSVEEFRSLVAECHQMGFKVILDWVGNHTAWDHKWVSEHPDWYTQVDGQITDPLNADGSSKGWTDVADLNYDAPGLHHAMVACMRFWVDSCDVDGFRCDVAMDVPAAFWNRAKTELDGVKPIFMLAESEEHMMDLYDTAFGAYYAWEVHSIMNQLAHGNKSVQDLMAALAHKDSVFPAKVYPMNFITNHDENAWNGTVFERMGEKWKSFAILSYALKGYPLIHTGQEVGLDHRLKFFEKDSVDWTASGAAEISAFYQELNGWKHEADLSLLTPEKRVLHANGLLEVIRGSSHFVFNFSETGKGFAHGPIAQWRYGQRESSSEGLFLGPFEVLVYQE